MKFNLWLNKNNTTPFTPTSDYNPATKKYVDDNAWGGWWSQSEPIADYQWQAIVWVLWEYTFTSAKTLTRCSLDVSSIPEWSDCILELRYQTSSWTNLLSSTLQVTTSDTLTNWHKLVSVTWFTDATMDAWDKVVAFLTSIWNTTPALNPVCYLDFN